MCEARDVLIIAQTAVEPEQTRIQADFVYSLILA